MLLPAMVNLYFIWHLITRIYMWLWLFHGKDNHYNSFFLSMSLRIWRQPSNRFRNEPSPRFSCRKQRSPAFLSSFAAPALDHLNPMSHLAFCMAAFRAYLKTQSRKVAAGKIVEVLN